MADVTFQRDDYKAALKPWKTLEDVCAGEDAVKARGKEYLPIPNPKDTTAEYENWYEKSYKLRANFYGATRRTRQGLVGAVFSKKPALEVPSELEYIQSDVDGAGVSIFQQSQKTLAQVLKLGRHALFVDYPATEQEATKAQLQSGLIRSTIVSIKAEDVTNWRTTKVGGVHKLSLVVINESYEEVTSDGFGTESKPQYRVLKLIEGKYVVEIYRQTEKSAWELHLTYTPKDGNGGNWDEIPFTFVGSENNDTSIDESPLYDLAKTNLGHYRNSAEYENNVFYCGHPQLWVSGLSEEWRDWLQKQGITIGANAPMLLPKDGAMGFAQAEPNTMSKEAMDQKEAQMVALGARLIQKGEAVKTATEAQADNESEHSVLSLAAENVSAAYEKALNWMARFMRTTGEIKYELNTDFATGSLDPQTLTALVAAWQTGELLPTSDFRAYLKRVGLINPEKTDDEIDGELEANPPGLNLDDNLDSAA